MELKETEVEVGERERNGAADGKRGSAKNNREDSRSKSRQLLLCEEYREA